MSLIPTKRWARNYFKPLVTLVLVHFIILCFTRSLFVATQPITATFSSYHEHTETGLDTGLPTITFFTNYFEKSAGSVYVFQLWTQPSLEGPSVFFFSDKSKIGRAACRERG